MEKIEIEDYIRTKHGYIGKVININKKTRIVEFKHTQESNLTLEVFIENIVKHSKNIIDLVEIGDYVNGYRVVDIMENMKTGELHLEMTSDYTNPEIGDCTIYNKDIKSIVTKEMFNCGKYEVENVKR